MRVVKTLCFTGTTKVLVCPSVAVWCWRPCRQQGRRQGPQARHHACLDQFGSVARSCPTAAPWTAAHQASQSITSSWRLLKLTSIEWAMPSNHLILCRPLLLPSVFPSIRVFSSESVLCIRWPQYWSFSFSISPSNEYSGLISLGWTGWISLQSTGLSRVSFNTTVQKHQFFSAQLSSQSNSHIHT